MKKYEELKFEIVFFTEDVVTASQIDADNDVGAEGDELKAIW